MPKGGLWLPPQRGRRGEGTLPTEMDLQLDSGAASTLKGRQPSRLGTMGARPGMRRPRFSGRAPGVPTTSLVPPFLNGKSGGGGHWHEKHHCRSPTDPGMSARGERAFPGHHSATDKKGLKRRRRQRDDFISPRGKRARRERRIGRLCPRFRKSGESYHVSWRMAQCSRIDSAVSSPCTPGPKVVGETYAAHAVLARYVQ